MHKTWLWLLIFSSILTPLSQAKQLLFERKQSHYQYLWQDHQGQKQQLQFELLGYPIQLTKFIQYRPKQAQQYILNKLKPELDKLDPKQARVSISSSHNQFSFQIQGYDQVFIDQLVAQINSHSDKFYQDYLQQQYFIEQTISDSSTAIMPDHNRFAKESAKYLTSWLNSSLNAINKDPVPLREITNYLLSFVQSIPYNQLRSKDNLRGAGYLTPIQVLRNNQGDCDSKTTLLASALKYLYPRLGVAIIYVPNHALLALGIPPRANDETVNVAGKTMVLAEPTGPALYPLGKVADSSAQAIRSGIYSYQRMDWVPPKFKREK
ncbi:MULTISPECIES: hypothetical protein [unclassified Agarivorans]|uniref:hypothetical protein n=1 Tax=unclassified Agarivorans TaxID=2636026 RepID=UPI003D7CBFD5